MAIYVSCRCGQAFSAEPQLAGQTVACPVCGQSLLVPGDVPAPPIIVQNPRCVPAERPRRDNTVVVVASIAGAAVVLLLAAVATHAVVTQALSPDGDQPLRAEIAPAKTRVSPPVKPRAAPPAPPGIASSRAPGAVAERLKVLKGALQGEGWRDKLVIAGGVYELDSPHSIWINEIYEPDSAFGPTIQGGAYVDSGCKITWAVIVKEFDPTIGEIKDPNARLRTIAGMQGLEVRDKEGMLDRIQIVFKQADHMLWLTVSGRSQTVDSAATRKILGTLRRVKSPEAGLAAFLAQEGQPRP